jgi:uncharacterized lipoprotein YehR (DUF1307 family)
MKKLFLLLLAAVMVFSLAACGGTGGGTANTSSGGSNITPPPEGWAKEFTVYIGGSDEWTPFAGKSGVTFANSDSKVLSVQDDGAKVEFTGLATGDSVITATLDGTESKALVHVRAAEVGNSGTDKTKVPLIRELPGSFHIELDDGSSEILVKDSYGVKDSDGIRNETPFGYFANGDGSKWYDMTGMSGYTSEKFTQRLSEEGYYGTLSTFRTAILYSNGSAKDDISQFDTGKTETIAGVKCNIYEIDDNNYYGLCAYWVEPAYHFCLKYVSGDGDGSFIVTEYEVPYSGANPLVPPSYDGLEKP